METNTVNTINALQTLNRVHKLFDETKNVSIDSIGEYESALLEYTLWSIVSRCEYDELKAKSETRDITFGETVEAPKDWKLTDAYIKRQTEKQYANENEEQAILLARVKRDEAAVKAYQRRWNHMTNKNIQNNVDNKRNVSQENRSETDQSNADLIMDEMNGVDNYE